MPVCKGAEAGNNQGKHLSFRGRCHKGTVGIYLSLRTGKRATIITTNLPFTRWEEVLKDKVLCSALVDRLCHKSYLVNMTGTSYRIKETKKIIGNK